MCGIAGAYKETITTVEKMLDRIRHRGPDGDGIKTHGQAVHGHVRLALVDLSDASNQPFLQNDSTLTFNGELWNYRALREAMQADGETFTTSGDTEILATMLNREGLACLPKLDGMFAFAWSRGNEHWLVRDCFGKIPVYLAKTKKGYLWASERKAFPSGMKPIAVPPGWAFNLVTGEWLHWYEMPKNQEPMDASNVLAHLRSGVQKRLAADAPVCCLISGGLDSSLILALAKEMTPDVTAYTAIFDNESSDLKAARRLCAEFGVKLIEVPVSISSSGISQAIRSIEIASKAQIEIAMLCLPLAKRIYADGFRACLSGEAADELFGGYGNFCIQASRLGDQEITPLRLAQLAKMARGNFVRCNKAFMSAGVECRLPFMEQGLVEGAMQLSKKQSPPGKILLKEAAKPLVPRWVIKRTKDTFQGGSGLAGAMMKHIANPLVYYNAELRKSFGYLPKD